MGEGSEMGRVKGLQARPHEGVLVGGGADDARALLPAGIAEPVLLLLRGRDRH